MSVNFTPYSILGILHTLKQSMKNYNYFIVLYSSDSEIVNYSELLDIKNKMIFYLDSRDKVELCIETSDDTYDFSDNTNKYNFITNDDLFNLNGIENETNYHLFISKIIKWNIIPHKNLLGINNSITYNSIAFCYTNTLVTSSMEIPVKSILLSNEKLPQSVTKKLNINDNSVFNFLFTLNKI